MGLLLATVYPHYLSGLTPNPHIYAPPQTASHFHHPLLSLKMTRHTYTIPQLLEMRHCHQTHLEDVPYLKALPKYLAPYGLAAEVPIPTAGVLSTISPNGTSLGQPWETVKCAYCGHTSYKKKMVLSGADSPKLVAPVFDLMRFPPGSRIIKIDPGMPIPKGAIPLPFKFDENYAKKQEVSDVALVPTKESCAAEENRVPLYADFASLDEMWEKGGASMTPPKRVAFKYDPLRRNDKNPYSTSGFYPTEFTDASSNENKVPSSSHTFNTEAESVSVTEYSSDSGIQIQLPAFK